MSSTPIADRLARVRSQIAKAAAAAGRPAEDIHLIAVSKNQPLAAVEAAIAAGQRAFGENTVQDALGKIEPLAGRDLAWHYLGHLQSNKAKFMPGRFQWLHSLDSAALATRLSRLASDADAVVNVLIEVNIARDPRKHGVAPEALAALFDALLAGPLPGLRLRGLMAIGPHPADESQLRAAFAGLRGLRDRMAREFGLNEFTELSMGMSGDFAEAIQEGSTMVRIGTAIFGERDQGVR